MTSWNEEEVLDDSTRKRKFIGEHYQTRGYFVSTVGPDEERVRNYIRAHGAEDKRIEQLRVI